MFCEYKKIIFLAAMLSTVSPWSLNSTHSSVVPKWTKDVKLRCQCENLELDKCNLDQMFRIRLMKRNKDDNWMMFAEVCVPNNSTVNLPHSINSNIHTSGLLGTPGESFLSVTWLLTDDDTVGSYQCEVDGLGKDFRSDFHEVTQTVNITKSIPTNLTDVIIQRMHEMQSSMDHCVEENLWPAGNFTLLSPASGCPNTKYYQMARASLKVTIQTTSTPNSELSSPSHLYEDMLGGDEKRKTLHFRYCRHPIAHTHNIVPWPKGTYCIGGFKVNICPTGFNTSFIYVYLTSSSGLKHTEENLMTARHHTSKYAFFPYCCRRDGDPDVPMTLPNNKPFYLYRYKGKCQKIRNMAVSEEWIRLDTTKDNYYYKKEWTPDTESTEFILRLCYYTEWK